MSKFIPILLLIGLLFVSCNNRSKYEDRKLFIESENLSQSLKKSFENSYANKRDTVYNFGKIDEKEGDSIIYVFLNADILPKSNLLDGTRKIGIGLLNETDSVGNPLYYVHFYKSEEGKWIRTWNLGNTSFYSDSLLSEQEICSVLLARLKPQGWKGLL